MITVSVFVVVRTLGTDSDAFYEFMTAPTTKVQHCSLHPKFYVIAICSDFGMLDIYRNSYVYK